MFQIQGQGMNSPTAGEKFTTYDLPIRTAARDGCSSITEEYEMCRLLSSSLFLGSTDTFFTRRRGTGKLFVRVSSFTEQLRAALVSLRNITLIIIRSRLLKEETVILLCVTPSSSRNELGHPSI